MFNYVFWHFDGLKFKGLCFSTEEMLILIKASKKISNYAQSLRVTSELFSLYPGYKGNLELSQGYEFSKMTKV